MDVRSALWQWRREQAAQEGVEIFRVLPNAVLESLAADLPQTKEALLAIKGIKEAKYRKYGKSLLAILTETSAPSAASFSVFGGEEAVGIIDTVEEKPLSVSQFLDGLNIELSGMAARVKGEVSSMDERERVVYFTLRDSVDGSALNCLMFRSAYQLSGVKLAIGDEVVVEGSPDIYKPSGRLSLKVGFFELAGEGALKKAYDALLQKLTREGLLALKRKRLLPTFPERIALITSEQGAAIGDFTMNLGSLGVHVDFFPVSVEGGRAVMDILEALRFFGTRAEAYDLLVMIRGGGSLESLQAFNNEVLVRAVATCPIPTLLGIGHEKDVTLAALVADVMVSTPTATAQTLRGPFDRARQTVLHAERLLPERFSRVLSEHRTLLERGEQVLALAFPKLKERFIRAQQDIEHAVEQVSFALRLADDRLIQAENQCMNGYCRIRDTFVRSLLHVEEKLREYDPRRVLELGYSLVRVRGTLLRSVVRVKMGESVAIQASDGILEAEVTKVIITKS